MKCKLCDTETSYFDKGCLLNKYEVNYFRCPYCGFVQTEDPYWMEEAYSTAIANTDIGLIQRNIMLSEKINTILMFLDHNSQLLDYGGGYGLFVRMMRDKGWDFEWYDPYCENLFAKHHERTKNHYDVVTSFEMLEHLPTPLNTLDNIFSITDTFICTTELIPYNPPLIKDWWYYSTETGQHISFYTYKSMEFIAKKYKKHYFSGFGLHIFSDEQIPERKIKFAFSHPFIAKKIYDLKDRTSLLGNDYFELTGKRI